MTDRERIEQLLLENGALEAQLVGRVRIDDDTFAAMRADIEAARVIAEDLRTANMPEGHSIALLLTRALAMMPQPCVSERVALTIYERNTNRPLLPEDIIGH